MKAMLLFRSMKILLTFLLLIPALSQAYGSRDWLTVNQHYNRELQHQRNIRGLNYMQGARRTTAQSQDDRIRFEHAGNLRNNNSNSRYHWRKELRKRD